MSLSAIEIQSIAAKAAVAEVKCGARVERVERDGAVFWVKRHGTERPRLAQRLHWLISPALPVAFFRSSPRLLPEGMVEREVRKYRAFEKAGLLVPQVLAAGGPLLVLSDAGEPLGDELKRLRRSGAAQSHDILLVRAAEALAEVHAAGLCHGRPHPRDMARAGTRIAFFDFEEEPEAAMPLDVAQARDVLLLFFRISADAIDRATPERALRRYLALATPEVAAHLREIDRRLGWLDPVCRALSRLHEGKDLRGLKGSLAALATLRDA